MTESLEMLQGEAAIRAEMANLCRQQALENEDRALSMSCAALSLLVAQMPAAVPVELAAIMGRAQELLHSDCDAVQVSFMAPGRD